MISWEDAVLNQCMVIEGAYVHNDPEATLNNLINWYTELAKEDMVSVWELIKVRDQLNEVITK